MQQVETSLVLDGVLSCGCVDPIDGNDLGGTDTVLNDALPMPNDDLPMPNDDLASA